MMFVETFSLNDLQAYLLQLKQMNRSWFYLDSLVDRFCSIPQETLAKVVREAINGKLIKREIEVECPVCCHGNTIADHESDGEIIYCEECDKKIEIEREMMRMLYYILF